VDRVQRCASEHAGVEIALAGAQADVEVHEPAHGEVEGRRVLAGHAAVEDETGVGAALVRGEEVHDGVSADLLLPVEGDPDVDRQRALLGEQPCGLEQEVGVALVVHRAAAVEVAVAELGLERGGGPELEGGRGLDVEVAVEEDGRCIRVAGGRADLTDGERMGLRLDERGLSPGSAHELADPFAGLAHVAGMRGIGAHAGDAEPV
jgi:hypothetical protein